MKREIIKTVPEKIIPETVKRKVVTLCDWDGCETPAYRNCEICSRDLCEPHRHYFWGWDWEGDYPARVCPGCHGLLEDYEAERDDLFEKAYDQERVIRERIRIESLTGIKPN